jgi:hypothetical protein
MAKKIRPVKRKLTADELATLLFVGTLIFSIWLRINPVLLARFPMNDGGMFFTMIQDLRRNAYALPQYTTYNNMQIPFAYPPLAFYAVGFLADIFHLSLLNLLLWLPAILNIATIPAFFLLANAVLETRLKAALATLIYMLVPLSMDWFLMGGGLTRGMGQLFLILTCWGATRLFQQFSWKMLLLTIFTGALVTLCHPESALLTVISCGIIWAFAPRSWQNVRSALAVCFGVAVLISPWLITVWQMHGPEPFIKAAQTNGSQLLLWTKIFTFDFTLEALPGFVAVLGLVGLFLKLSERKYLLPLWVILPFFINPRSSSRAAILPLAMLAAIALLDVILPVLVTHGMRVIHKRSNLIGYLLAVWIILLMLGGAYSLGIHMAANRLSESDQQAMVWVQQNAPIDAQFVIITGETQLLRDPLQEWFPTLTARTSQTTLQGREWIWGEQFIQSITAFDSLQHCINQNMQCVQAQTQKLGLPFGYLYIQKQTIMQCVEGETCQYNGKMLVEDLKKSSNYALVYESSGAAIFSKAKNVTP